MKNTLLDLLYPPKCAFCGRIGVHGVCDACAKTLPYAESPLREGAGFVRCAAPLRYEGVVRDSILRFKFHGASGAAADYAPILSQCVAEELGGEFDVVTWAPVSKKRLRERGYDQSRLLAVETAKVWDVAPVTLLKKTRDNPPQSGLGAPERRGNVIGVYEAVNVERIQNARILLIDDIVTTGSTLAECVRVLKEAGAQSVVCACLAQASVDNHK